MRNILLVPSQRLARTFSERSRSSTDSNEMFHSVSVQISVFPSQTNCKTDGKRSSSCKRDRQGARSNISFPPSLSSGVLSPSGESAKKRRRRLPATLVTPIESAQRRLEYFCIGLAGSLSNAVRRNWLALNGDRTSARNAMVILTFPSTVQAKATKKRHRTFCVPEGRLKTKQRDEFDRTIRREG